jgi:hypothetical protein
MFSVNLNAQIADVVKKGSFYYTLDEKGKQIKSIHENSAGELQGFTDRFVVFHKGSFYATYDENFKKNQSSSREQRWGIQKCGRSIYDFHQG